MIPAGLPSQALWPYGRDATSMAFLSTPGIERLYSGVTNSTASAALILLLNATHEAGGFASMSWLKNVSSAISMISGSSVGGATLMNVLAILRLKDSLRRLPTTMATE